MERVLAFKESPRLSTPLRFFLSAPAFALLAGLLLLWNGPQIFSTRWGASTLAATHLLTLGFLANVMIGALMQILPVVTRIAVPWRDPSCSAIHLLLTLGTLLLTAAFLSTHAILFRFALLCLVSCFGWLLAICTLGLWRAHSTPTTRSNATLRAIRLALIALALTASLGVSLASTFAWPIMPPLPLLLLTDLHVTWGLPGWIGLLIIGVAFQVIPMFQVTPIYPARITSWLAAGLFIALCCWSLARFAPFSSIEVQFGSAAISILVAMGYTIFGVTTLILLARRKRPKPDATTWFWRLSMVSLILCAGLWSWHTTSDIDITLPFGVLMIVGVAMSAANGMLYKIVSFLIWFHLSEMNERGGPRVPNVNNIISEQFATRQCIVHFVALLLLLAASQWPGYLTRIAGLALTLSAFWLWWNLFQATRLYQNFKCLIEHANLTRTGPTHDSHATAGYPESSHRAH